MENKKNYLKINELDIFSKRLPFIYKESYKLSSLLTFILSSLYILIIFGIFCYGLFEIFQRNDLLLYNYEIFPENIHSFKIDKSNFNFIFGIEYLNNKTRFIDESIYYPEVIFYKTKKYENNIWENINKTYLNVTSCSPSDFDELYYDKFNDINLNKSYCIKDYNNIELKGGDKFDEFDYILIKIYPCKNNSKNNIICKSNEEIENILENSYFTADTLDIGLTPDNYIHPYKFTKQNLYTYINIKKRSEYILTYKVIEIQTDKGLFWNKIKMSNMLQFDHGKTFKKLNNIEGELINIQIKLSDNILIQKRVYKKLSQLITDIGGYMEFFFIIFSLIAFLPNKYNLDKSLINDLFKFNRDKIQIKKIITFKVKHQEFNIKPKIQKQRTKVNKGPVSKKWSEVSKDGLLLLSKNKREQLNFKRPFKRNTLINLPHIDEDYNKIFKINNKKYKINSGKLNNRHLNESNFQMIQQKIALENKKQSSKVNSGIEIIKLKMNFIEYITGNECITDNNLQIKFFNDAYNFFIKEFDVVNIFNLLISVKHATTVKSS